MDVVSAKLNQAYCKATPVFLRSRKRLFKDDGKPRGEHLSEACSPLRRVVLFEKNMFLIGKHNNLSPT